MDRAEHQFARRRGDTCVGASEAYRFVVTCACRFSPYSPPLQLYPEAVKRLKGLGGLGTWRCRRCKRIVEVSEADLVSTVEVT